MVLAGLGFVPMSLEPQRGSPHMQLRRAGHRAALFGAERKVTWCTAVAGIDIREVAAYM